MMNWPMPTSRRWLRPHHSRLTSRSAVAVTPNGRNFALSCRSSDEAVLASVGGRFAPRVDADLVEDISDVAGRGGGADIEELADLAVGVAGGEQAQHLQLALGECAAGRLAFGQRR